jgi:hypothetical protein
MRAVATLRLRHTGLPAPAPVGLEAAETAGMRAIALTTTHTAGQLAAAAWGLRSLADLRVTTLDTELRLAFQDPLWIPE